MIALGEPQLFERGLERKGPRPAEAGADDLDGHLLPPESGPIVRSVTWSTHDRVTEPSSKLPEKAIIGCSREQREGPGPMSRCLQSTLQTRCPAMVLGREPRGLFSRIEFAGGLVMLSQSMTSTRSAVGDVRAASSAVASVTFAKRLS